MPLLIRSCVATQNAGSASSGRISYRSSLALPRGKRNCGSSSGKMSFGPTPLTAGSRRNSQSVSGTISS